MKIKIILITMILFLSFPFIFAQDNTNDKNTIVNEDEINLDTETAVSLALANNLKLQSEKIKFQGSTWNMITSWNKFIPTVSMSATLARSNLNVDDRTTEYTGTKGVDLGAGTTMSYAGEKFYDYSYNYDYEVERPKNMIMANFNMSLNLHASQIFDIYQTVIDYEKGKLNLDTAKKKLVKDVKKNMYNLILLQKQLEIQEQSLANTRDRYQQTLNLYNNGQTSKYEMLSSQVSYERMKPVLIELRNGYSVAELSFKQMLGLKKDVTINYNANFETAEKIEFNADELIAENIYKNLDLKNLKLSLKDTLNKRNTAISALTPGLNFSFTMDPTFQLDATEQSWFESNYEGITNEDWMEDYWKQSSGAISFSVSLPVSSWAPFSKEQMNIVATQFAIKTLNMEYENAKELTAIQIESTILTLEKIKKSIDSLEYNITLAKQAYDEARRGYNSGSMDQLTYKDSEIQLKNAQLDLLSAEYDYTASLLELEYILDTELE